MASCSDNSWLSTTMACPNAMLFILATALVLSTPFAVTSVNINKTRHHMPNYSPVEPAIFRHPYKKLKLQLVDEVPYYKLVSHYVRETEEHDPKVHDLDIQHMAYFTHVFLAWQMANRNLSVVALTTNNLSEDSIIGCNMVLEMSQLAKMYAPGKIEKVLNFVRPCYQWAAGDNASVVYISTLRTYATNIVNQEMLSASAQKFLATAPDNSRHLVWESNKNMREYMKALGYEQVTCGGDKYRENPCDWTAMDLPPKKAQEICIYRLHKPSERITNASESQRII